MTFYVKSYLVDRVDLAESLPKPQPFPYLGEFVRIYSDFLDAFESALPFLDFGLWLLLFLLDLVLFWREYEYFDGFFNGLFEELPLVYESVEFPNFRVVNGIINERFKLLYNSLLLLSFPSALLDLVGGVGLLGLLLAESSSEVSVK